MSHILTEMWPLLQEVRSASFAARRKIHSSPPPIEQIKAEFGLDQSANMIGVLLYMLDNYDGDKLSTAHYRIRNGYDNPSVIDRDLARLAADGLLETSDESYQVTEKGRRCYTTARTLMRPRWEIPTLNMDTPFKRLFALLQRLVDATFHAPEPPLHWSVTTRAQYGMKMSPDVLPLERLDWHTFDLWAYRDDCHLASWAQYDVSPFAWEALSYLWNEQADSAEKLAEVNAYREFTADEWATFLDEVALQGWANKAENNTFQLSDTGKEVRDKAEQQTDAYFYGPWQILTESEVGELRAVLTQLRDSLKAIAEN